MSDIKEVDVMADFKLTLDHFYSLVKTNVGNLQTDQKVQIQLTAIPIDVSPEYTWFSLGNLAKFFDVRIDPVGAADNVTLLANAKFSNEYILFLSDLLSLVEYKELDAKTLKDIDVLGTRIRNYETQIWALRDQRREAWESYARGSMHDLGDVTVFEHWSQKHWTTKEMYTLAEEQARDQALSDALRIRRYTNPEDQAVVDAYAAATSPASRMRYPLYRDSEYGEEAKKFNVIYFARLPDNESSIFANRKLLTTTSTLSQIASGTLGSFSDTLSKTSVANSSITTDWSASGSGGYRFIRVSASVSSHQSIKNDFSSAQSVTVGAKSLQALPIVNEWLNASMFSHPLVLRNRRKFERYLGDNGTLRFYPTHLIMARGLNFKFTSSQNWSYDYASDFSAKGSAKAKIFGVGWGGGGSYSQSKREQRIETRGHDLIMDDGDNLRLLGYVVTENKNIGVSLLEQGATPKSFENLLAEEESARKAASGGVDGGGGAPGA
ncbi:hypothetical protein V6R86_08465 [Sphingomonas kaistensis]|uniref:Uncharacterized protein n=1 Tax=Sphingomonas kaistensis TaxID=298708 RepID=A0ABZ2G3U4_9SPHN